MKQTLFVLAILAVSSGARAATFLCFGDSITNSGGGPNAGYLGPLATYLGRTQGAASMDNQGKDGETTVQGRTRLNSRLTAVKYDYVLLMEGTNDVFRWAQGEYSMDTSLAAMADMVRDIQAHGATAIVATIVPFNGNRIDPTNSMVDEYNRRLRSLGATIAEVNASIRPFVSDFTYYDTVHPGPLGHTLVAEAFAAAITGQPLSSVDIAPPIPTFILPEPFSTNASLNSDVQISVTENKHPFDAGTAVLKIDGAPVAPAISANASNYNYSYRFPAPLQFGQQVSVEFTVADANVPPNQLVLAYTFRASPGNGTNGDVDRSGRVDGRDLAVLGGSFGTGRNEARYRLEADIDASGFVDGVDLAILSGKFGGPP